jgi:hypothetical protein
MELSSKTIWMHIDKGSVYTILHDAIMKVEGIWIDCIVYKSLETQKVYVRSMKSFVENFKELPNERI